MGVINKCFEANDYCMVQGYPGTGKTEVLSLLLELLIRQGKRVLFCAYTNAALDGGLIRLLNKAQDKIIPLRMGSNISKIHPDIRQYSLKQALQKFQTVDELRDFVNERSSL